MAKSSSSRSKKKKRRYYYDSSDESDSTSYSDTEPSYSSSSSGSDAVAPKRRRRHRRYDGGEEERGSSRREKYRRRERRSGERRRRRGSKRRRFRRVSSRRFSDLSDESGSGSSSEGEHSGPGRTRVGPETFVRGILEGFPGIAVELKELLQKIDDGQGVDISGISEKSLMKNLKKLFVSLNLKESGDKVFLLRTNAHPTLEVVGSLIAAEMGASQKKGEETILPDPDIVRKTIDDVSPALLGSNGESSALGRHVDLSHEHSDDDNDSFDDHSDHDNDKKSGRGVTLLEELKDLCVKGKKIRVEFNAKGQPIGKWRPKYMSYIGVLARTKVNICIPNWRKVSQDIKDSIWQDMLSVFDVDASRRRQVLRIAGERWRDFKSKLTTRFITDKKEGDEDPIKMYKFIDQETWEKFVASRLSQEFQDISEANRERQARNKCKHRLSRGGYIKLEQMMVAEQQASQSDSPSSTVTPEISRAERWKRARMDENGEFLTEESMIIAQKIDFLTEQAARGEFTPDGRRDILAEALGTEEHPGRVRGVGGCVGIKDYFGSASRPRHAGEVSAEKLQEIKAQIREETMEEIKAQIKEETRAEMEAVFEEKMSSVFQQMGLSFLYNSTKANSPMLKD